MLWHGVGVDERDVLEPLAAEVAGLGVAVVVPDWESEVPDGGRAHLLASLDFARGLARARPTELATGDDGGFVLAGWSRGGRMAASLALNPETAGGWRPTAVVCLAGGFRRETVMSPVGNGPLADLARAAAAAEAATAAATSTATAEAGTAGAQARPVPFHLVHGTRDTRVDIRQSREFAAAAAHYGWPARLAEPDTDHAGVVMTEYDPARQRCRPTTEAHAVTAGRLSARTIAHAARTIAGPTPSIAGPTPSIADAAR